MVFLVEFADGQRALRQWRLQLGSRYTLGRNAASCGIQVPHFSVSRNHALLSVIEPKDTDPILEVSELGGVNGTFVDGIKMHGTQRCSIEAELSFGECPHLYRISSQGILDQTLRPKSCSPSRSVSPHGSQSPKRSRRKSGFDDVEAVDEELKGINRMEWSKKSGCNDTVCGVGKLNGGEKSVEECGGKEDICRIPFNKKDCRNKEEEATDIVREGKKTGVRRSRWAQRSPSVSRDEGASEELKRKKWKGFDFENLSESDDKDGREINGAGLDEKLCKILAGVQAAKKRREAEKHALVLMQQNATGAPSVPRLTVQEKRKLLWGKKKTDNGGEGLVQQDSSQNHGRSDEALDCPLDISDPNHYALSFNRDEVRKTKFLKLMGFKGDINATSTTITQTEEHLDPDFTQKLNSELEMQYFEGIRRKDGRKIGLGM